MTAPDILSDHNHGNTLQAIERTDQQYRDEAASGPCGFTWCEVETLQDAVCGNGLSLMESRDDSRYEQFMSSVDSASKAYGAQSIHVADLYVSMGIECAQNETDARSKELALLLLEEAFGIYQAKAGDSHERTVDCRIHLGKAHHSLGRYDEALDCFCMAVYMREALLGEPHPSVSEIWVLISSVHRAKSKLELSLKASAKALTGYRNAYGDKHPIVIEVLETIAGIHIEMGNREKAVDIQKYVRLHSPKIDDTKAEF